ncbi:hypothetical protein L226DRAFT_564425 [Lentinus tigrinus ALCF2SS1-7]|uniref:uncharacterized protein n=1 Tax=Lentinus tigrinus ALCF2SS1-7 TaxID=1328758 RepID=UPI001165CB89|nr:hypothetical protein L226DRAFT_564425 [Lentinus tigrinus ALCF2SS1-7]
MSFGHSADGAACPPEPSTQTPPPAHVYPPSYATKSKSSVFRIEPLPLAPAQNPQRRTAGSSATETSTIFRSPSSQSVVDETIVSGPSHRGVQPVTARRDVNPSAAGPSGHNTVSRRQAAKLKLPRYNRQNKTHGDWAGSEGPEPINAPPIFENENDIRIGDVYRHLIPDDCQLWLRVLGDDGPFWLSVPAGYEREDGRFLSLTQQKQEPSWITSSEWCNKCIRAAKRRARD